MRPLQSIAMGLVIVLVTASVGGYDLVADPVGWVLTGGEDHALAATFPEPAAVPAGWRTIGTVTRGSAVTVDGGKYEGGSGWQHFR